MGGSRRGADRRFEGAARSGLDFRRELGKFSPVSEMNLNGGEISILKTLGLGGGMVAGKQLAERMEDMDGAEFLDTLAGLMTMDYVLSNKVNIRTMEAVESASFRVNPACARELKDAVYPSRTRNAKPERRQRRS